MMKNLALALALALMISAQTFACTEDGKGGIVEENDLYIPIDAKRIGGITETQFNAVIDKVSAIYAPFIASLNARLEVQRKWTDGTANASATRERSLFGGKTSFVVKMYGGLARHEAITVDGFTLVLCHEIGHHIGGAPKNKSRLLPWASNEGQADYFGTLKCLRKTFLNDDNAQIVQALNAPALLTDSCTKAHPNELDKNICVRSGMAGLSLASFFAGVRHSSAPKFDDPSDRIVPATIDTHPPYQCRLDTYFAASLCEVGMNENVAYADEVKGTCHKSLGHTVGLRPTCWFKPTVE